jgi:hypothetical protein
MTQSFPVAPEMEDLKKLTHLPWVPASTDAEDIERFLRTCRDIKKLPITDEVIMAICCCEDRLKRFRLALRLISSVDPKAMRIFGNTLEEAVLDELAIVRLSIADDMKRGN